MPAVITPKKRITTTVARMEIASDHEYVNDKLVRLPLDDNRVPLNRLHGAMSMHLFRALVDDYKISDLYLQGTGEPLLTPNLSDMIRYAKFTGTWVSVDTNATLLYRDRAEELVEANLDRLRVVIDGSDARTYEDRRHVMANIGPILENLAGLSSVRRAARSDLRVQVDYVATEDSVKLLPDVVALLGGIWTNEVRVLSTLDPKVMAPILIEAEKVADEYCVVLDICEPKPNDQPYFAYDGRVCNLKIPKEVAV